MITVKFFASLRERLGVGEVEIACPTPATIGQVWAEVATGQHLDEGILMAHGTTEILDNDHLIVFYKNKDDIEDFYNRYK